RSSKERSADEAVRQLAHPLFRRRACPCAWLNRRLTHPDRIDTISGAAAETGRLESREIRERRRRRRWVWFEPRARADRTAAATQRIAPMKRNLARGRALPRHWSSRAWGFPPLPAASFREGVS